jgi:hypothetical protein
MGRKRGEAAVEMDCDAFDAWCAASKRVRAVHESADERGGPSLSLVPAEEQELAGPTDLIRDPQAPATEDQALLDPIAFGGHELRPTRNRLTGWSAVRQRYFLATLAETGSVHLAADAARLSARSAYHLRTRSPAFAKAWDTALQLSVGRLSAIVFDRAINGRVEQIYGRGGDLIGERRVPSDKLLTWLLARLDPKRFALPWEQRGDADPQAEAVASFSGLLSSLADTPS